MGDFELEGGVEVVFWRKMNGEKAREGVSSRREKRETRQKERERREEATNPSETSYGEGELELHS